MNQIYKILTAIIFILIIASITSNAQINSIRFKDYYITNETYIRDITSEILKYDKAKIDPDLFKVTLHVSQAGTSAYITESTRDPVTGELLPQSPQLIDLNISPIAYNIIRLLIENDVREELDFNLFSPITYEYEKLRSPEGIVFAPQEKSNYVSKLAFVNSYFTLFGGERLGLPLEDIDDQDVSNGLGVSFGFGTPYGGVLETNFYEANFHIMGASIGAFNSFGDITAFSSINNHNNVYASFGIQAAYVLPQFLKFIRIEYQHVVDKIPKEEKERIIRKAQTINSDSSVMGPKFLEGKYFNWELRWPITLLDSRSGKAYFANYQKELHIGLRAYDIRYDRDGKSIDFRIDYMFNSDLRRNQLNLDILLAGLFKNFGEETFAIGPSLSFSKVKDSRFPFLKGFANIRINLAPKKIK